MSRASAFPARKADPPVGSLSPCGGRTLNDGLPRKTGRRDTRSFFFNRLLALSSSFYGKICAVTPKARCARASMIQDIKSKALDLALSQIEKQFGKGSIMKLGEQTIDADIPVIPTGSPWLGLALRAGRLPRWRVV